MDGPLGLGVVGTGRFAEFCLAAYHAMPEVRVVAVADVDLARAQAVAPPGARAYGEFAALLADPEVEILVISTPPYLHGPMACQAAEAGKHVLVEKPLATTLEEAQAAVRAARGAGVQLTVDYVLRHHPLHRLALEVAGTRALGELHHLSVVNLATDEDLPADHWFWDPERSGGIHVEHGVHFYDLSNHLIGERPDQVWGWAFRRPDGRVDRVGATVRYGDRVLATFYHSFRCPRRVERTTIQVGFSRGQLWLEGWIPTRLQLIGLADGVGLDALRTLFGPALVVRDIGATEIEVNATVEAPDRQEEYRRAVQAVLRDLVRAIRDGRPPEVTPADGLASLAVALAVSQADEGGVPLPPIPVT